ncbi:spermatogenesis-associated protein 7 homolog [Echeneis naucrates]|uniref:spermatogenesis-associated protein 7 homolog n=1 Tax=Echeneis naucrates TaxID=173247 RepID=UPI001113500F|nr:spermatogenesis-associated protein 7 [Echeneis naucrates]
MGYAEDAIIMDSRAGSVSSGLGCSSGMRGQTLKSSPFYPRSSSNLTQSIIRDHMVSHYKKVYSAKAAIDTSVPKSMTHSVKYNDQIRKDRLKKGGRPQSAHSLSQSNSRASSSAQSGLSAQYDGSPYLCSRSSMVSSPRFSTSFHAKETVYQSSKADHSHHTRPASEIKYRSPALHRKQSACSLTFFGDQNCYKTFQDPVRKTYSGDLLQKHSKHFTQDKPFTPKTLISDKNSYLAKYRYYRAPRRKPTQDCTNLKQETYYRSTKTKECTQESDEPLQGFITDHEQSEDEFNGTYFSASRQRSWVNKSKDHYLFASLSRVSPEDGKSPIMKNVSAEEEELMYLEFISAVTEDILARGHISNRVLDRVIKRHIEMNQHQLDEGKMRHLLDVLRKEFEEETNSCTSRTELEKKEDDPLNSLLSDLESGEQQVKTKKDHNLFPYASLIKDCNSPFHTDTLSVSTPLCSPESTASNEKDKESDNEEKYTGSPWLSEHVINNTEISEEDFLNSQIGTTATHAEVSYENHEHTTVACDETFHHDQGEASYTEQSKDLENLGISLSQSLHVSVNQQHENTAASVSDDEF